MAAFNENIVEMLERLLGVALEEEPDRAQGVLGEAPGALGKYQNRAIETAQVIEELIVLPREMRESRHGQKLGLNEDEVAYHDALEVNDSATEVLGEATLPEIARELADTVPKNTTIDRMVGEQVLRKHTHLPDKQEKAVQTVIEQAQPLASDWTG